MGFKLNDLLDEKQKIKESIISNQIIALWFPCKKEDHELERIWKGMSWDIPEEYKKMQIKRIFGIIPEHISESDIINIELIKEEI